MDMIPLNYINSEPGKNLVCISFFVNSFSRIFLASQVFHETKKIYGMYGALQYHLQKWYTE